MTICNPKTGRGLKNPEKYIARLQSQLNGALIGKEYYRKLYNNSGGTDILSGGWEKEISCKVSTCLINLSVGDVVAEIGRVISVSASKCQGGNKESSLVYEQTVTRKMPRDFIS